MPRAHAVSRVVLARKKVRAGKRSTDKIKSAKMDLPVSTMFGNSLPNRSELKLTSGENHPDDFCRSNKLPSGKSFATAKPTGERSKKRIIVMSSTDDDEHRVSFNI